MGPHTFMLPLAVAAVVLAVASRTRPKLATRLKKPLSIARVIVGLIFGLYGLVKVLPIQLEHHYQGDIQSMPPDRLFWYFFSYSRVYAICLGLAELTFAILLIWPRTARLGALGMLAMMANITLMDFLFDIGPVKWWALGLSLFCMAFIVYELDRYRAALATLLSD